MNKDILNATSFKGLVNFYNRRAGESEWKLESQSNLVVNNAREIVRNLVLGSLPNEEKPAPTISFLVLGDMNMTLEQATAGVSEPSLDDKVLINPLLWVPTKDQGDGQWPNNKVTPTVYNGFSAIKYDFFIGRDQGNVGKGFFNEIGLAIDRTVSADAYLFTKLNRSKPLLKDVDIELLISYILMF